MNIRERSIASALTCVFGLSAAMTAVATEGDATKTQTYDSATAANTKASSNTSSSANAAGNDKPSATGSAAQTSSAAGGMTNAPSATGASTASAANAASADGNKTASAALPPVVLLVPVDYATDEKLGDGCWVRLYDSKNYGGGVFTLVGDVDVPNMRPGTVTGLEWGPNYDSVEVGPNATFTAWDDENYRDRTAMIGAGQRVADLSQRLRFGEDMESLKVDCQN